MTTVDHFVRIEGGDWNIVENGDFRYVNGWHGIYIGDGQFNAILNNRMDYVGALFDPREGARRRRAHSPCEQQLG